MSRSNDRSTTVDSTRSKIAVRFADSVREVGKTKTPHRLWTNGNSVASKTSVTDRSDRSVTSSKSEINVTPLNSHDNSDKTTRYPTQWGDIVAASIMFYLMLTVSQSMLVGAWPYMLQLDSTTPIGFAGYVMSVHRIGHGLGTAVFAYYTFISQSFRKSLLAGRVMSTIGCVLYLTIEFFPVSTRRYVFLLTFLLNALGEGSTSVIRSYVPRISTTKDRQTAYSVVSGANMLSIISGPALQIACMGLSTSGISLGLQSLKLNLYTGPIWIAFVLNLGAIYISIFRFTEPKMSSIEQISGDDSVHETMRKMLKQLGRLDKSLIAVCFVEKSVASVGFVSMITMLSPYIVTTFNVPPAVAVKIVSLGQGGCGLISLITVALFVFSRLGKKFKASILFPFAIACFLVMYAFSYPLLPYTGMELVPKNVTAPNGCDTTQYEWCDKASIVKPHLWLPLVMMIMGVAIPVALIAFDTIYSNVLGGIDQNLLQGAVSIIDDIAAAIAPVVAARSFASLGPVFWLIFALIMALGLLLWAPVYPRLKKMKI